MDCVRCDLDGKEPLDRKPAVMVYGGMSMCRKCYMDRKELEQRVPPEVVAQYDALPPGALSLETLLAQFGGKT